MQSKSFSLGTVLSITDGRLLTKGLDDVYQILDFMTDDSLQTIAIPRARQECVPALMEAFSTWIEQAHEDIQTFFASWDGNLDSFWAWMETMEAKYGATHEVWPIHPEDHVSKDPVQELLDMGVDPSKIISFDLSPDEPSLWGH